MAGQAGDIFLIASLFLSAASAVVILYKGEENRLIKTGQKWGPFLSTAALTASLLLIGYYFLASNFNYQYVFDRTSASTPAVYRLSAMWAGQAGTFLMWAWVILLSAVIINRGDLDGTVGRHGLAIILLGGAFFTILAVAAGPFDLTLDKVRNEALTEGFRVEDVLQGYASAGFYDANRGFVDGTGLNPMLQTPYNAVHPPMMFFGYGLVFVVFAASLAYLFRGKGDWESGGRTWARLSWLLMTGAMAIGGLWAYEELAYGGFWTWDPIEAASLLPWLTLTAYLHGSGEYRRRKKLGILTPFLGVLTTLLIIYSTYITRSGIIKSSHSYAGTSSASYLIIFVLAFTAAASYLALKRISRRSFNWEVNLFSQSTMIQLSIIGLLAAAGVVFWGLTEPVIAKITSGVDKATSPSFYNKGGYIPVVFLIFIGGMSGLLGPLKKELNKKTSAGTLFLSALFSASSFPTPEFYVNALTPIALFAVGSIVFRSLMAWRSAGPGRAFYRKLSPDLAHIGIIFVVTGAVVSGSLSSNYEMGFDFNSDRGRFLELGNGYSVRLDDIKVFQDDQNNWVQDGFVTVVKDDGAGSTKVSRMINDARYGHLHSPFIVRGVSDVYGVFMGVGHQAGGTLVFFNFRIIPFVNLLWLGVLLLIAGMGGVLYLEKR